MHLSFIFVACDLNQKKNDEWFDSFHSYTPNIIHFDQFLAIMDLNMQCDLGLEKHVWFAQKLNRKKS